MRKFRIICMTIIILGMLAGCIRAQDEGAFQVNNILDYLAMYAVDSYENEYFKLNEVEGIAYVHNKEVLGSGEISYSISIYNQGYYCGSFGVRTFPKEGIQSEAQMFRFQAELSSQGITELISYENINGVEQYIFEISDMPFAYGDTEWMVNEGIFEDIDEACSEANKKEIVLWTKAGLGQCYYISLNMALVSEEKLEKLERAVFFKENAFESSFISNALVGEKGAPFFKNISQDIISYENASKLTYTIEINDLKYEVPEHTVALYVDAHKWDLYCYTIDGYEEEVVGTIFAGPNTFEDNTSILHKEALFSKEQQDIVSSRKNTKQLKDTSREFVTENWVSKDGSSVIRVKIFKDCY